MIHLRYVIVIYFRFIMIYFFVSSTIKFLSLPLHFTNTFFGFGHFHYCMILLFSNNKDIANPNAPQNCNCGVRSNKILSRSQKRFLFFRTVLARPASCAKYLDSLVRDGGLVREGGGGQSLSLSGRWIGADNACNDRHFFACRVYSRRS